MHTHIRRFLDTRSTRIPKLEPTPMILSWLRSPGMESSLSIIDNHVKHLSSINGGVAKTEEWFLSGDVSFNAITAERYVLQYLCRKNDNLVDSVKTNGIDACIVIGNEVVGIEVTTLNGLVGDWVFVGRLPKEINSHGLLESYTVEIAYSHDRVRQAMQQQTIYDYISRVGQAIASRNDADFSELQINVEYRQSRPGFVVFHPEPIDRSPWFKCLTDELWSKLTEPSKTRQLKKYTKNLVIVGINHASPSDGVFPRMFGHLCSEPSWCQNEIRELTAYWRSNMELLSNVIGICFYVYSLDREIPFYPLEIIWQSEEDRVDILI